MKQLRLMIALEIVERADTRPPPARPRPEIVDTTGHAVEPRPLAKCGQVVAIETWRKRRAAGQ